ncbi:glycosyltransferase family 4 protein [Sphingobacterium bambusae]|uniref:Glycosyltransferase family 4 protein n=1 Tax=Sphingobacterium bambusae TaxID=662858 RepID=A0ABW6BB69_9SPHI|nr:glycosyltransferase family 4 protein [Sphingobacterium bambusae]WPL46857.1 glycosyltransferase family 4 protein [Sphingobacterium bambusae]
MILHICNDFSGSTVYKNLFQELDGLGISQSVYHPTRDKYRINKNHITFKNEGSRIHYDYVLNKSIDRIWYRHKIKKIVSAIERKIDLSKIALIHAHTWYSDGGAAYILSQKYGIPYVVSIRNSDVNIFHKFLLHERAFGKKILENAKAVVTISAAYRKRILALSSLQKIKVGLNLKLDVIPNGVDPYWIMNAMPFSRRQLGTAISALYVGKFDSGKNVLSLVRAVVALNAVRAYKIVLNLVGEGGADHKKIEAFAKRYPDQIILHGKISEKEKLRELFNHADFFAMPSKGETFGLVYVEAMLCGLPVIYTEGEGIDGFYPDTIGTKVRRSSLEEVKLRLDEMVEKYQTRLIPTKELQNNHNWAKISLLYKDLYEKK